MRATPRVGSASVLGEDSDDLPHWIEKDFERRAMLPRLGVLLILLLGALVDYGHGHRAGHWFVLLAYGFATLLAAASTRSRSRIVGRWLPIAGTCVDALIATYVIADHLPRDAAEMRVATDAVSLLPAFLFLLQTGLRLRPGLTALFAGLVAVGWTASILLILGPHDLVSEARPSLVVREGVNLIAFLAASAFVLYASVWTRNAAASALRAWEERVLLSRFLPAGVATDVVRAGGTSSVVERHATLLSVDLRGSSTLAREHLPAKAVEWLLDFRRLVHDAVTAHGGIIDKYIGDGVLALFLDGDDGAQATCALAAVGAIFAALGDLNDGRERYGQPRLRIIAAVHCGRVLAGVFDDGRRAEFTVLGSVMNDLSRIERRAKEADRDVVASADVLKRVDPRTLDRMLPRVLAPPTQAKGLPDLFALDPLGFPDPTVRAAPDRGRPRSLSIKTDSPEKTP